MREETVQARQATDPGVAVASQGNALVQVSSPFRSWPIGIMLCTVGLVICLLLTVTPLMRLPDTVVHLHIAIGSLLATASGWWPRELVGLSQTVSAAVEGSVLILLAFLCYGLAALLVHRGKERHDQHIVRGCIWLGALVAGALFVVTPAMLSHDILVYASYSRVLAVYHANPYFVPIAAFPHDPFTPINYWARVVSAYGPIWMLVCAPFGWLLSPDPVAYVVAFRVLALAIHLLNTWLVGRTLQIMGRAPRTVTLGMLFYAWNPLLLLESGLGGHNDGLMMSFVLTGVLLAARTEARGQLLRPRGYVPASIALTLAVLVKFTALPILAAYLLLLACRALRPTSDSSRVLRLALRNWRPALRVLCWSGLAAVLVALVLYGPFWFGHGVRAIVASFKKPPSALGAENSFMRSILEWRTLHPEHAQNSLLQLLGERRLWDDLTFAAIAVCLLLGLCLLWSQPTSKTFVVVSLLTMCAVLLITPWFFSWYIIWLLGLAALCLSARQSRLEIALLALSFTFSISAFATYLFTIGLFGSHYYLVSLFTTIPPACAFLLILLSWKSVRIHVRGKIGKV